MMSIPSPTASRMAATARAAFFSVAALSIGSGTGTGMALKAVNPRATLARASSANASGSPVWYMPSRVPPPRWSYRRKVSRTGPPSRSHTGLPSSLPLISHNARSMPLIAV